MYKKKEKKNYLIPLTFILYNFFFSSGMIDLKELSLVSGKAAWMAYLVEFYMYCIYQISVSNHRNNVFYGAVLYLL
jgi:hypothetical protein